MNMPLLLPAAAGTPTPPALSTHAVPVRDVTDSTAHVQLSSLLKLTCRPPPPASKTARQAGRQSDRRAGCGDCFGEEEEEEDEVAQHRRSARERSRMGERASSRQSAVKQ